MPVSLAQLEQLYLAYFGRPADFDGVAFYTTSSSTLAQVEAAFSGSAESRALYGTTYGSAFVNAIYRNVFGRDADAAGLAYWVGQIASGAVSPAAAALVILQAAKNDDALAIANKLSAATTFTNSLASATDILAYQGGAAAAAARTWLATVGATSSSLAGALANLPSVLSTLEVIGGARGVTFDLTTGIDTFLAPVATLVDTVNGVVDFASSGKTIVDHSTFSVLDAISGNGHTVVNVALLDTTGGAGDAVAMSGIAQLNFTNAQAGPPALTFDGSAWKDVASIRLNGLDGAELTLQGVTNTAAAIRLKIDGGTDGTLDLNGGRVGGVSLRGTLVNATHNGVGATAAFGDAGVDVALGTGGFAQFTYEQKMASTAAAAAVGDLGVAHVSLLAGATGAYINRVAIYHAACATSHDAAAGSLSLGDVLVDAGATGAYACLSASNAAESFGRGSATVGHLAAGSLSLGAGTAAVATACITNLAYASQGAAMAGSLTIGDVNLEGVGRDYLGILNAAYVSTSGAATAGDLSIGNVASQAISGTNSHFAYLFNQGATSGGSATSGNIAIGDLDMVAGFYNCVQVGNFVSASATSAAAGAAKTGNTSIGNICFVASGTGTNQIEVTQLARMSGGRGTASVGNIQLGQVGLSVATSANAVLVFNAACNDGTGSATAGSIVLGNVRMNQSAAATGGEDDVRAGNHAYSRQGSAAVGNITVGDVNINAAGITAAYGVNTVCVSNDARAHMSGDASTGNITIGNVLARTGIGGNVALFLSQSACAATGLGSTGTITVGNVAMEGQVGAALELKVLNHVGKTGTAGGLAIGNVSVQADMCVGTACASFAAEALAGNVGAVSLGNVDIQGANLCFDVHQCASAGDVGDLAVGNVALEGNSLGGGASWIGSVALGGGDAGQLTVGNIDLADAAGQTLKLDIAHSAPSGRLGATRVGNIAILLSNTDTSGLKNEVALHIASKAQQAGKGSGDITVGDIQIANDGVTTKATLPSQAMHALVTLSSVHGNITVGNISVHGGLSSNFPTLSDWLRIQVNGASTVTIGNVDYSDAVLSGTIDVSTYQGAAVVKGAAGGGSIRDNAGVNALVFTAPDNPDTAEFVTQQSGVREKAGALAAAQDALDSIAGFAAHDRITVVGGVQGTGVLTQGNPQTWAHFLEQAELRVVTQGDSAFYAVIGGTTYLALNTGGHVGEIVAVLGAHSFSWSAGVLVYAS